MVAIGGKPKIVVDCIETIHDLLQTVSVTLLITLSLFLSIEYIWKKKEKKLIEQQDVHNLFLE